MKLLFPVQFQTYLNQADNSAAMIVTILGLIGLFELESELALGK